MYKFLMQETDAAHCKCPCLPKCCPPNHILSTEPDFHGLSCQPQNLAQLPQVPILGHEDGVFHDSRFIHSGFPSCEGTSLSLCADVLKVLSDDSPSRGKELAHGDVSPVSAMD